MSRRPNYGVTAYRSGKWWALEVPRVRGALSQCRRLDQAEALIREAIAAVLDVRDDSFDISLDVQLPGDVRKLVDGVADARAQQEVADQAARRAMQATARQLVEGHDFSTRDAGKLLGVSHQRISQVMQEDDLADV